MATIISRKRGDGSTAHMAQIVVKRKGRIVHRENRTFDRRQAAYAWAEDREKELKAPGGLERVRNKCITLSDAIDKYLATSERQYSRTKIRALEALKAYPIASSPCNEICSHDILELATELGKTRQPQTVLNYLSCLSSVFSIARPAWGYELDERAMSDALKVAKRMGLVCLSHERTRRPTMDELDQIQTYFVDLYKRSPKSVPMHIVVPFALFSTRRQSEITRITWADLDDKDNSVLVRDMKDPGGKRGNDVLCEIPDEAMRIVNAFPKTDERIFPYKPFTLSYHFHTACEFYGIKDLKFHDLRHEGITRLFEMGRTLPQVAAVSGHKSWHSLKRYTHIRKCGDKYEHWKWLDAIT
ncbi:tyrosine-type recombinase/integrase [Kaustia mangrovi]|uniref:Tyrosine-type recombinase/integrase n=1 Tax=Kaustia mangrovi TaxID=2593653 RepID=A0A7S8C825_9HYPH|nr:tyrosine-type recombinase/integrase [Kaustia mangrovi]QPC44959.1 tyrosine-type recombinase/integrase [Kaustia mangrovi]